MKAIVHVIAACGILFCANSLQAGVVTAITDNAITMQQTAPAIVVSGTPTNAGTPSTITNDITSGVVDPFAYYPIGNNISEVNVAYQGGGGVQGNFFRWTISTTDVAIDEVIFTITNQVPTTIGGMNQPVFDAPIAPAGWTAYTTGAANFLTFKTVGATQPFLTGGPLVFLFETDLDSALAGANFNLAMQAGNPEPGSMALAAVAMTMLGGGAARRRRKNRLRAESEAEPEAIAV